MVLHFVNGSLIFPAIYVYALYGFLPGSPVGKGTAWGIALWLMAQLIVMPTMGGGVFSSAVGGMMAAVGSLIGHLLLRESTWRNRRWSGNEGRSRITRASRCAACRS